METTSINGVDLAYRIDGDGSKPWLVLSNSLASDHRMWEPQMGLFTQTHRILRYDTRGHGQSQASDGPYTFPLLVSDVIGLMDHLNIEIADVLGLSLGGMTALGLAIDHPGRVNWLICCDARADAPSDYAEGWHQRIDVVRAQGLSGIVDGSIGRWLTGSFRADPANAKTVDLCREMILSTTVEGFCGCAAALTQLNYAAQLKDITAPTLCIVGDEDAAASPEVMAAMAKAIPNAQLQVIKEAAHIANLNAPMAFNKTVSSWYAK